MSHEQLVALLAGLLPALLLIAVMAIIYWRGWLIPNKLPPKRGYADTVETYLAQIAARNRLLIAYAERQGRRIDRLDQAAKGGEGSG